MTDRLTHAFTPIAQRASAWAGSPWAFLLAVSFVVGWAVTGPLFHYSSSWQLIINTGTTVITFLMVFLIQGATNTGDAATHLKLDALLEADAKDSDARFIGIEDLTEPELRRLKDAMRAELSDIYQHRA